MCCGRTVLKSSCARPRVPPDHPDSYYSRVHRLVGEIDGAWKPDQYSNRAVRKAITETTGPEIWRDTDGKVTHFVAGVGTGGTITGTGRYLKEVSGGKVTIIGADPEGRCTPVDRPPVSGRGCREDFWPSAYDPAVPQRDHRRLRRRLLRYDAPARSREGLLVGGSCRDGGSRGDRGRRAAIRTRSWLCCCPTAVAATCPRSSTTSG